MRRNQPGPGGTLADAARQRAPASLAPRRPAAEMLRGAYAQLAVAGIALTGLWVAISPWFLTLQAPLSGNARANDLIIGLAVTAVGVLAIAALRGLTGLPAVSLLAGIWLIISPFILNAKFPVTASMYWSNIWAGAIIAVASLCVLAAGQAKVAR